MRLACACALGLALAVAAGCGEDEPADNAVEAREGNVAELAGVRYRVMLFRELNVRMAPDDALWHGPSPGQGSGLYMVAVRACAGQEAPAHMTSEIHLEDAFGQRFRPRRASTADGYEYSATWLAPEECRPVSGSAADRVFDGAVLVFKVPFESTEERPMVLELGHPSGVGEVRVQLDL